METLKVFAAQARNLLLQPPTTANHTNRDSYPPCLRVLLIGSGARENALARHLSYSHLVERVFVVPGNAGSAALENVENVELPLNWTDLSNVINIVREKSINIAVPSCENAVAAGLINLLQTEGILLFGPCKAAGRLETDKEFGKRFMESQGIPTAAWQTFSDASSAHAYIAAVPHPVVIKALGMTRGRGVLCGADKAAEHVLVEELMNGTAYGHAGARVLVEQRLVGDEYSVAVVTDGRDWRVISVVRDHKTLCDRDEGPYTGGMGACCPLHIASSLMIDVKQRIIQPTFDGLLRSGLAFPGIVVFGILHTSTGPNLIEYDVRWGDPETQSLLAVLETDLADLILRCALGRLNTLSLRFRPLKAVTVVLVAKGYPDPLLLQTGESIIFNSAGSSLDPTIVDVGGVTATSNTMTTAKGRVLTVTVLAGNFEDARELVYESIRHINFKGMHFRKDIATCHSVSDEKSRKGSLFVATRSGVADDRAAL